MYPISGRFQEHLGTSWFGRGPWPSQSWGTTERFRLWGSMSWFMIEVETCLYVFHIYLYVYKYVYIINGLCDHCVFSYTDMLSISIAKSDGSRFQPYNPCNCFYLFGFECVSHQRAAISKLYRSAFHRSLDLLTQWESLTVLWRWSANMQPKNGCNPKIHWFEILEQGTGGANCWVVEGFPKVLPPRSRWHPHLILKHWNCQENWWYKPCKLQSEIALTERYSGKKNMFEGVFPIQFLIYLMQNDLGW